MRAGMCKHGKRSGELPQSASYHPGLQAAQGNGVLDRSSRLDGRLADGIRRQSGNRHVLRGHRPAPRPHEDGRRQHRIPVYPQGLLTRPGGSPCCYATPALHRIMPLMVLHLRARRGFAAVDFSELWRYRDLLWILAARDIRIRYKQAALGAAWAVLQPLAAM